MNISKIYNNKSFQKYASVGALVIGAVGMLSGVFLAASGNPAALGILPSAMMFGMGCLGLHGLSKLRPS